MKRKSSSSEQLFCLKAIDKEMLVGWLPAFFDPKDLLCALWYLVIRDEIICPSTYCRPFVQCRKNLLREQDILD